MERHGIVAGDCTDAFGDCVLNRFWPWRSVTRTLCGRSPAQRRRADRPRRLYLPVSRLAPKSLLGLEIGDEDLLKCCHLVPLCANPRSELRWAKPPRAETPEPIVHAVADGDCTNPFRDRVLKRFWTWRSAMKTFSNVANQVG